jgi:hypothetical protein
MPRPVKDDPRDRFKTFRFTEAELARLEARARASRRTVSSYVRMLVLDGHARDGPDGDRPAAVPQGKTGPPAVAPVGVAQRRTSDAMRRLAEEMRRVGVNLNQIARRMNEQRTPPPRELTMLLDQIRAYVREAREP